jgi:hypothetical protein
MATCPHCDRAMPLPSVRRQRNREAAAALDLPAKLLMIAAIIHFVLAVAGIVSLIVIVTVAVVSSRTTRPLQLLPAVAGIVVSGVLSVGYTLAVVRGIRAMRNLESFGWAIAACVLMLPTCLGVAPAIWALVVLLRPEVQTRFGMKKDRI